MALRTDQQGASVEVTPSGALGPLVAAVLTAHDGARPDAALALNDVMASMGKGLGADDAQALLAVLDERALTSVVDAQGRPVRAVAIEALLRAGYPWALQIDPDALAWYRARPRLGAPSRGRLLVALVVVAAAVLMTGAGAAYLLYDEPRVLFAMSADALAGDDASQAAPPLTPQALADLRSRYSGPWGTLWAEVVPRDLGPPVLTWHTQGAPALRAGVTLGHVEVYLRDGTRVSTWPIASLQRAQPLTGADPAERFPYLLPAFAADTREPSIVVVRGRWDGKEFAVRSEGELTPRLAPR